MLVRMPKNSAKVAFSPPPPSSLRKFRPIFSLLVLQGALKAAVKQIRPLWRGQRVTFLVPHHAGPGGSNAARGVLADLQQEVHPEVHVRRRRMFKTGLVTGDRGMHLLELGDLSLRLEGALV